MIGFLNRRSWRVLRLDREAKICLWVYGVVVPALFFLGLWSFAFAKVAFFSVIVFGIVLGIRDLVGGAYGI